MKRIMLALPFIIFVNSAWAGEKLYLKVHHPLGERVVSYQGQGKAVVTDMLTQQGLPFDFVDKASFDDFMLKHEPVPPTPVQLLAIAHKEGISEASTGKDPTQTLVRASALVLLDEINAIRAVFPGATSLPPRTAAQLRTAITNKINSGLAD